MYRFVCREMPVNRLRETLSAYRGSRPQSDRLSPRNADRGHPFGGTVELQVESPGQ